MQQCQEHEEAIKEIRRKIDNLDGMREIASKLSVLMEVTIESNKQRDEIIKQQSQTLIQINENLSGLNYEIRAVNAKVDTLEEKVKLREQDTNLNIMQLYKEFIKYIIIGGLGGAVVTFIIKAFD